MKKYTGVLVMKKSCFLLLIAFLSLVFSGCGNDDVTTVTFQTWNPADTASIK